MTYYPPRSRQIATLSADAEALVMGRANEDRIEGILERMIESGEIRFYHRSRVLGELDKRGIDFQVYPEADWSIDLQVKSSESGKTRHAEKYGCSIACVVVDDALDDRQLLNEVRRVLGLMVDGITARAR